MLTLNTDPNANRNATTRRTKPQHFTTGCNTTPHNTSRISNIGPNINLNTNANPFNLKLRINLTLALTLFYQEIVSKTITEKKIPDI